MDLINCPEKHLAIDDDADDQLELELDDPVTKKAPKPEKVKAPKPTKGNQGLLF